MGKVYTATRTYTIVMKDTIAAKNRDAANDQLEELLSEDIEMGDIYSIDLDDYELEGEGAI